jgi:hypothetical protein
VDELGVAHLLADGRRRTVQWWFRTDLELFWKDHGTFATAADLAIEDGLRHRLHESSSSHANTDGIHPATRPGVS